MQMEWQLQSACCIWPSEWSDTVTAHLSPLTVEHILTSCSAY